MIDYLSQQTVQDFIQAHLHDDPADLMLSAHRKEWKYFDKIVEQIKSRQKAKGKLNHWLSTDGLLFPPAISVEQASSDLTAAKKASLIKGGQQMVDLTGGFGIDSYYLSKRFYKTIYVERSSQLCELAAHNFELLEATIEVVCGEAEEFLEKSDKVDLIFLDPARRDEQQRKVFQLSDCSPDISAIEGLLVEHADEVLIKLSPLLDIKSVLRDLVHVNQIFVLAVKNEVKELLVQLKPTRVDTPTVHCINLDTEGEDSFQFSYEQEEQTEVPFSKVKRYLYEPNSAILKAGAFKMIAKSFSLFKLHENTHLYTSDRLDTTFPGRIFDVVQPLPIDKKKLRKLFPDMKAHITIRNFPSSVAELRKKTTISEGGDHYIFACSGQEGKLFLLTKKIKQNSHEEWG